MSWVSSGGDGLSLTSNDSISGARADNGDKSNAMQSLGKAESRSLCRHNDWSDS